MNLTIFLRILTRCIENLESLAEKHDIVEASARKHVTVDTSISNCDWQIRCPNSMVCKDCARNSN